MTVEDLLQVIRVDYLNDTVEDYRWTDEGLLRSLNEAERQACNRADLIPGSTDITLVLGQNTYTLSNSITRVTGVFFNGVEVGHSSYDYLKGSTPGWRTDTGLKDRNPVYFINGRTLTLSRSPTAIDVALDTLTVEYFTLPSTTMESSTDEPSIPSEFHRDLIYWVLHEAYSKGDPDQIDVPRSQQYLQQFESVFGPYVSARVRQHQFEQPKIGRILPSAYNKPYVTTIDNDW